MRHDNNPLPDSKVPKRQGQTSPQGSSPAAEELDVQSYINSGMSTSAFLSNSSAITLPPPAMNAREYPKRYGNNLEKGLWRAMETFDSDLAPTITPKLPTAANVGGEANENTLEETQFRISYYDTQMRFEIWSNYKREWLGAWQWFLCFTPSSNLASSIFQTKPPEMEALAPETAQKLRQWLHDCHENHPYCVKSQDALPCLPIARPKRLIEISNLEDPLPHLRLRESSEREPLQRFAALSYCWGESPQGMLKCLSSTVPNLSINIPWKELPKTIQDAISVCQTLGIGLLWVDALCIAQDDVVEKELEIAKMGRVYGAAFFTILASRASSAREGFLHQRAFVSQEITSYSLPFESRGGLMGSVTMVPSLTANFASNLSSSGPLDRRGWAYQEKILSSRIISFHEGQTTWRCAYAEDCDGWQIDSQSRNIFKQISRFRNKVNGSVDLPLDDLLQARERCLDWWRHAVDEYSDLAFTIPSDRAVAISAIVQELNHILHDKYLAGIWKSTIPEGFLWRVDMPASEAAPACYQGPSWSWMSINTRTKYDTIVKILGDKRSGYTNPYDGELLDAVCTPIEKSAPYGSLQQDSTYIVVRPLTSRAGPRRCSRLSSFYESHELSFGGLAYFYCDHKLWEDVINQPPAKYIKFSESEYQEVKDSNESGEDEAMARDKEISMPGEYNLELGNDDEEDESRYGETGSLDEGDTSSQHSDGDEDGDGMSCTSVDERWSAPAAVLILKYDPDRINALILRPNSDGTYRRVGCLGLRGNASQPIEEEEWRPIHDMIQRAERKEIRIV